MISLGPIRKLFIYLVLLKNIGFLFKSSYQVRMFFIKYKSIK